MSPILFEFFGIKVYAFSTFLIAGFILTIVLAYRLLKKYKKPWSIVFDHIIFIFFVVIIAGRLFHVIIHFSKFEDSLFKMINILDGKLFLWGSLFALFAIIYIFLRRERQNIGEWGDILTSPFMLFMSFLSLGNFMAQKNFGIPTDMPWGMIVEGLDLPFSGLKVHPVDLYFSLFFLTLFLFSFIYIYMKKSFLPKGMLLSGTIFIFSLIYILIKPLQSVVRYLVMGYDAEKIMAYIFLIISFINIIILIRGKYAEKTLSKSKLWNRVITWDRIRPRK